MPDGSENLPWPDEEPRDDAPQDQEDADGGNAAIDDLRSLADLLADLMNGPAWGDERGGWPHPFTPQFE